MRHQQRTAAADTKIEIYTTFTSEGCNVGAGEDVAMGIMVGIANNAVGCWQERNTGIWLSCISTSSHMYIIILYDYIIKVTQQLEIAIN